MAQVDGNTIATDMANRGRIYKFQNEVVLARNGRGEAVGAGYARLTWVWDWLNDTEFAFWYTTVCDGALSKLCTGTTQLHNELKVLTTYSSCVVHRPVAESFMYGLYRNVTLLIDRIKV